MPEDIYHRPANRFVATVVGTPPMNFLPVTAVRSGTGLVLRHELFETVVDPPGPAAGLGDGAPCLLGVRPEDVHVTTGGGIPASVYVTEPLGGETVVDLDLAGRLVKALVDPTLALKEGDDVHVSLDGSRLHLFDEHGVGLVSAAGEPRFNQLIPLR